MALNSGWAYTEQVGTASAGQTALAHLAASRLHSSVEEWDARFTRGEVELNGVRAVPGAILRSGQTLVWHRPPWDEPDVPLHYEVLHDDEAIVGVNKPSGLPTMPAGGFLEHTLLALVRRRYPAANPMHRLGRFTSGVVLFARTHEASSLMLRAWRHHEVKKQYRALGSGLAARDHFEITVPIGLVPHPQLGTIHAAAVDGRPSHSTVTVLERRDDSTLFAVGITTGRPHQIRIHLGAAGHPLVGDTVYGVGGVPKASPGLPGEGGFLLHSESLRFAHPLTAIEITLRAAPPVELLSRDER
ncbi:MAG: RluA family pseudouridine synthase [Vicinamibacterales bacterium]